MANINKRILVVDDEQDLCEILKFNLETEGYSVDTADSAEMALTLDIGSYDLLLLDVMMGGMSGFALAKNLGADDYISKPFSIREVLVRVRAVLRRTSKDNDDRQPSKLKYQGLELNLDNKTVCVDGENVPFTKTEFEILRTLLEDSGRVFSRQELINRIWPSDVLVLDRTVDVNITRLRKKIGPYSKCIVTRLGFGYFFDM